MDAINEVTFEQAWEYLVKVVCPDVNFLYPNPIPKVNTPDADTIIYYYSKHFPNRNAPKMAAIEEGYSWVWEEFKSKTEGKIWSLDKTDRKELINKVANFFDSLKADKEAYNSQIPFLEKFGNKQLTGLPEDEGVYMLYDGNTALRQAKALELAVWIIEEGTTFFKEEKKNLSGTSQDTADDRQAKPKRVNKVAQDKHDRVIKKYEQYMSKDYNYNAAIQSLTHDFRHEYGKKIPEHTKKTIQRIIRKYTGRNNKE